MKENCRLLVDLGSGFRVIASLIAVQAAARVNRVQARSNLSGATRLYLVQRVC